MQLNQIVETSRAVAAASGRRDKVRRLAAALRAAGPEAAEVAVGLLTGRLRQGRIGIGWATLRAAVPEAAAAAPSLTLAEVDAALAEVAATRGAGAAEERKRLLGALLARATAEERDFLLRAILGELRQGALEGLMAEALAEAAGLPLDGIRRPLMAEGDLGAVARVALAEGAPGLERLAIRLFRPVKPMLAQSARDPAEALARFGRLAFEAKLDGARIQAHKDGDAVRVFTRSLNEVTGAVPEVVEALRGLPVRSAILDGEVLAVRADGRPEPFQVTMRRFGRKADVEGLRAAIPLRPVFFDCLYLDGTAIVDRPARARFAALAAALPPGLVVRRMVTEAIAEADAFLAETLAAGHEGVMAKSLAAPYEAGARGSSWLKIKPAVTLDLVVLAAEWGHGRRQGRLSNLHLGARDPATGGFVMLGKTFKGMTDAMLAWQTGELRRLAVAEDRYTVHVRPALVVEVAFNDIQASPHYPGGLALRFARVKRYRTDKRPEDADTVDTVRAIHARRLPADDPGGA